MPRLPIPLAALTALLLSACSSSGGGADVPDGVGPDGGWAPPCNFYQNVTCDPDNARCVEITWGGAGASCGNVTSDCALGFFCDAAADTCVAEPAANEPCPLGLCASGSRCDPDTKTCAPLAAAGEGCAGSFDCADGLFCNGGTCGALQWEACAPAGPAAAGSDPYDPTTVVAALAAAACGYVARCQPVQAIRGSDPSTCESDYITSNQTVHDAIGDAISANRASFSQAQLDACVDEYATVDCDLGLTRDGPCDNWLVGAGTADTGCFFGGECAAGLFCGSGAGSSANCGTCQERVSTVGGDCSAAACLESLRCSDVTSRSGVENLCLPVAGLGAPCGTIETGLCAGDLICGGDDPMNPTCRRLAADVGDACD